MNKIGTHKIYVLHNHKKISASIVISALGGISRVVSNKNILNQKEFRIIILLRNQLCLIEGYFDWIVQLI